jgi:hypothetical protein
MVASRIPAVTRQLSRESNILGAGARAARAFFGREPMAPAETPALTRRPPAGSTIPGEPPPSSPLAEVVQPKPDKGFVTLTAEDIAQHPEFERFRPGYEMDRKTYQDALMGRLKPTPPGRSVKRAMAREAGPTRPITTEGKPALAPAPEPPNGPGVGRGKSGAKLAREAAYNAERAMQPEAEGEIRRAIRGLPDIQKVTARRALATLASGEASAAEQAAAQTALRSVLGKVGGGALMAVPFVLELLQGRSLEQQVNEAAPFLETIQPNRRPAWLGKEPAYGEPGYRGPI